MISEQSSVCTGDSYVWPKFLQKAVIITSLQYKFEMVKLITTLSECSNFIRGATKQIFEFL